jgi:hypothetical protein
MKEHERLRRIADAAHTLASLLEFPEPADSGWMMKVHRAREKYLSLVVWLPVEFKHFPTDDR